MQVVGDEPNGGARVLTAQVSRDVKRPVWPEPTRQNQEPVQTVPKLTYNRSY